MPILPPADETKQALKGAFAILKNEPNALAFFNLTPEGFVNSFKVLLFVLAPFGLQALADRDGLMQQYGLALDEFPSDFYFAISLFGIGIEWVLMPILLWFLAGLLTIKTRYGAYIIARNWCSLVAATAFAVPAIAQLAGLTIPEVTMIASLCLLGFVLFYHYRIARVTLDKPPQFCVALVTFDFMLGFIIAQSLWVNLIPRIPGA